MISVLRSHAPRRLPTRSRHALALGLSALALAVSGAHAQSVPDAGSLLRQIEQQRVQPLPPAPLPRPAPPPPMQQLDQASITVRTFRFAGNTLLRADQLAPVVASFLNRPLTFAELQSAAIAVANAYRQAGWVVRAYLPRQDVTDGDVTIQVVEATFGRVQIEGKPLQRMQTSRLRRIVEAAQPPGQPLNGDSLDRALLLIDDLPGVSATGRLTEGQRDTETDLLLSVADAALFSGDLLLDNTGARSTGVWRLSGNAFANSPAGFGDQLSTNLLHTQGSNYLRLGYTVPVGYGGWRLGANTSHLAYQLQTPAFAALDAKGTSTTAGAEATYPLLRSRVQSVYFSSSVDFKRFDNLSGGVTTTQYKTSVANFGLNGNRFDEFQGGGVSSANLTFSLGRVNLAGSPNEASDAASVRSAGSFNKLRYGASRQQTLPSDFSIYASFSGQAASKNLDSSEKFYLGGSTGVRAYPSSEGGGSAGQLLTLELRARAHERVNLSGFFDIGSVTVNKDNAIAGAAALNSYTLKGVGVSAAWSSPVGVNLKATLARRIGDNPNPTSTGQDQDGTRVKNRVWLQASLPF
ncbi:MAG: ShlB/FhaC/HecB family hemolysin secretion/activation protein [Leptothrix sp. (in: b-proteobacteria)]